MSEAPNFLQRIKFAVRLSVAVALHASGVFLLWKRIVLRDRAVVLTYHRVLPSEQAARSWSHPSIIVTPATFDRHLRILRRWFRPLTLAEFVGHVEAGNPFPAGACLITFDDGWVDTYTEAWPALKRHQVPATVFLPVRFIGSSDTFWQERLGGLLFEGRRRARADAPFAVELRRLLASCGLEAALELPDDGVRGALRDLVRARKRHTARVAERAIAQLEELLGPAAIPNEIDRFMTWEQVREMAASGVTFGGHGMTHRMLTTLPPDEVIGEVCDSREDIVRRLSTEVDAFCYPNGDVDTVVATAVRGGGYRVAFSTTGGPMAVDDDRYAIRRVNIHQDMTAQSSMFLARVLGAF